MNQSVTIADRLREERSRLGMSQAVLGEVGGVTKKTQLLYENGDRVPDANYLAAIAAAGADALYILTGQRMPAPVAQPSAPALTADEVEMVKRYRTASKDGRDLIFLAVKAADQGSAGKRKKAA